MTNPAIIKPKDRIEWIDNLRVVAIISVIMAHIAGQGVYNLKDTTLAHWSVANLFESFRFPIFIMISGTVLLNRDYSILPFLKKRLTKILVPFLLFSFVYITLSYNQEKTFYNLDIANFVTYALLKLKNGSFYHLWYVYVLIGLYFMTPILRVYVKNASQNNLLYLLIIWLVFNAVTASYFGTYVPNLELSLFAIFPGYFILGYYLSNYPIASKKIGWALFLTGIMGTFSGALYYAYAFNEVNEAFYNHRSITVMLQSIGIYILLYNSTVTNPAIATVRNLISRHSYTIYLSHALIIIIMMRLGLTWNFIHPIIGILAGTIVCLAVSLFLSILLKNIPVVGRYF
ncbi:acyltransferase [Flavobacterium subsaxonicum]|uniref:Acyltransferase 3 domain-containing protein n=1 Tax=Flavobacterium subsaxonicum WB 4.1-42 = DSM 21790 TaxID=1121898 RepID=A0A0A2MSD7_9FLAO|nr:acyltransferase family protein [Flavobacterium subsaxonicum]KGO94378.1 hypothetical protein Q766_05535 [Flavobacterium subsaxonicum WB 4.1-42 = DSM 21790]